MLDQVYEALQAKLISIEGINFVDMYNGQYLESEDDARPEFARPAVFVEFLPIDWKEMGQKVQYAEDATIRLHIVSDDTPSDTNSTASATIRKLGLAPFKLVSLVHKSLSGFSGPGFSSLSRTNQETDNDASLEYVHIVSYHSNFVDESARPVLKKIARPSLVITPSLNVLKP
jgi:hypothetical protein